MLKYAYQSPLKIKQNVKLQYLNVNSVCIGLGLGYKRALNKEFRKELKEYNRIRLLLINCIW